MTDAFQIDSGTWLSGDEIASGVKTPRVKVQFGSDNTAIDVSPTNPIPVAVVSVGASTVSIIDVQTAAAGSDYVTFADTPCNALEVVNSTGTTIEYRRGGTGVTVPVLSGTARKIVGITNANQISLRRVDVSNTQVRVAAEAFL